VNPQRGSHAAESEIIKMNPAIWCVRVEKSLGAARDRRTIPRAASTFRLESTKAPAVESGFPRSVFRARTRRLSSVSNGGNSLLIFPEIRIKLLGQAEHYAQGGSGPRTSGGNISNSHLPGLSPNFIPGISKPRDATACTGKTTFRWPAFCADRKGKLFCRIDFRVASRRRSRFPRDVHPARARPRENKHARKSIRTLEMPAERMLAAQSIVSFG